MYSELHMCLCPIVWLTDVWIMMPLMTSYLQAVCRRFHGGCCSDLVLHRTGTSQSATDSYHGLFWNTHIHSERTTWLPNSSGNFLILTQCLMLKRYCLCDPCEGITVFFHLRCGAILWQNIFRPIVSYGTCLSASDDVAWWNIKSHWNNTVCRISDFCRLPI